MKKSLVSFIALLFLIIPLSQNKLLAGGSDSTGYIITNNDMPQPYDLGGGDIITTGNNTHGVYIHNSGNTIKSGGSITTDGNNAHGINISGGGSSIDLTDVAVTANGSNAYGLRATDCANVVMSGGSIQALYDNTSSGNITHAVYINQSDVTLNNVNVANINGNSSHAFFILRNSTITINGGSIYTDGSYSNALHMEGGDTTLAINGVNITAENGDCLEVGLQGTVGAKRTDNEIYIYNSTMTSNKRSGVSISGLNYLEMKDTSITTNGTNATGFAASYGAKAYLENISISLNGAGNYTVSNAMNVQFGAQVTLKGADICTADPNTFAIITYGSSTTDTKITGLESTYNITGGIYADKYVTIDIAMEDYSVFNGWASYANSANSIMNLALKGANTLWNLQGSASYNTAGNSYLTNLTLDGSTIDYTNADWGARISTRNLNLGAGSTGGTFIMKTDILSQDRTDLLYVAQTTAGNHTISVTGDTGAATDGTEKLILVETEDQGGNFALATGTVDNGAWRYELEQDIVNYGSGAVWQLSSTSTLTNPASNAVNTFSGAYLLAYAETQTLMQRLGDLRQTPHLSGLWFRVHGGKFESNSQSFIQGFDLKYGGVQIGYDRQVETRMESQLYVGGMFSYSRGDLDYLDTGSGTVDSKALGVYGTYIGQDGFYVDAVLKYQWIKNDFDALDYSLDRITGNDVSTGGLGASLEIGKRIYVEKDKKNSKTGWYVEPQAQLIYQHQDSGSFTASNGLHIGVDSFTSLIGRVGTLVGYETGKTNIYAKISYVKEFDGDVDIIANDVSVPMSFGDNWLVYGIGFTSVINERNSVYASIERASGGTFTQPWRAEAGWRIVF